MGRRRKGRERKEDVEREKFVEEESWGEKKRIRIIRGSPCRMMEEEKWGTRKRYEKVRGEKDMKKWEERKMWKSEKKRDRRKPRGEGEPNYWFSLRVGVKVRSILNEKSALSNFSSYVCILGSKSRKKNWLRRERKREEREEGEVTNLHRDWTLTNMDSLRGWWPRLLSFSKVSFSLRERERVSEWVGKRGRESTRKNR